MKIKTIEQYRNVKEALKKFESDNYSKLINFRTSKRIATDVIKSLTGIVLFECHAREIVAKAQEVAQLSDDFLPIDLDK